MVHEQHFKMPEDVQNDASCKSYIHYHVGNTSPLAQDYCHYVRQPDERDDEVNHQYCGDWVDVTEDDRVKARIEAKKKELADLERQRRKMEEVIKKLEQGIVDEDEEDDDLNDWEFEDEVNDNE